MKAGTMNMPSKKSRHTLEKNGKFLGKGRGVGMRKGYGKRGKVR